MDLIFQHFEITDNVLQQFFEKSDVHWKDLDLLSRARVKSVHRLVVALSADHPKVLTLR